MSQRWNIQPIRSSPIILCSWRPRISSPSPSSASSTLPTSSITGPTSLVLGRVLQAPPPALVDATILFGCGGFRNGLNGVRRWACGLGSTGSTPPLANSRPPEERFEDQLQVCLHLVLSENLMFIRVSSSSLRISTTYLRTLGRCSLRLGMYIR